MKSSDFVRQLPEAGRHLGRPQSLSARLHIDVPLLVLLLILAGSGLFILYSASGASLDDVFKQAGRIGVAFVIMFALAQLDPATYRRWSLWIYLAGIGALIAVLVVGVGAKGAQRWLQLPGLPRFQPSEFMKLAVPMTVAWYLASRTLPPRLKHIAIAMGIFGLPVLLVIEQPDLGTAILIAASGLVVLFMAGLSWKWIGGLAGLIAVGAPIMWFFVMLPYQKQRVLTFLNPEEDPLGSGWNIIQSKTAIGSGGLSGKGWLSGTQSHLDFLPESHTDFIIAVLAEEFGLLGVCLLLLLYVLIVARGLYIASQAQDTYSRLAAGCIAITFFVYVFVNIGMVSGLLPVVGVPLPLISYGGTSALTLMAGFGILMSIHTHKKMLTR